MIAVLARTPALTRTTPLTRTTALALVADDLDLPVVGSRSAASKRATSPTTAIEARSGSMRSRAAREDGLGSHAATVGR